VVKGITEDGILSRSMRLISRSMTDYLLFSLWSFNSYEICIGVSTGL